MLNVTLIKCLTDNYSYLITDSKTKKNIVIDPAESTPIEKELNHKKQNLDFILVTHHHHDHVGGNLDLKKKYNCKIIGFDKDANRIPGIDIRLNNNQIWDFGEERIQILHAPGHTSGHVFYNFINNKYAFVGDIVFSLGCGRIFEGSFEEMFESVNKVKSLPEDTKIFCGHEYTENNSRFCKAYDQQNINLNKKIDEIKNKRKNNIPTIPTTVKEERLNNIFFRCDDPIIKQSLNMIHATEIDVFKKLRQLKDNF
jgi:hydroxyacylglutathione hydrolase